MEVVVGVQVVMVVEVLVEVMVVRNGGGHGRRGGHGT